jgi:hypothetical protein
MTAFPSKPPIVQIFQIKEDERYLKFILNRKTTTKMENFFTTHQ